MAAASATTRGLRGPAAAPTVPHRRTPRPLAAPCRFVGGGGPSDGGRGSPAPPHPATTTLEEAFARLAEARLAASEAVGRLARMANDPDEAVAELVCKLASSPRAYGGLASAAARQRRRSRQQQQQQGQGPRAAMPPWALPPVIVVRQPAAEAAGQASNKGDARE